MIVFFKHAPNIIYAVQTDKILSPFDTEKLTWLFGDADIISEPSVEGFFMGTRAMMITPWSTNAVEITQNMSIKGINRIEKFEAVEADYSDYDPMLNILHQGLRQDSFDIISEPKPILAIEDIGAYNAQEGLSLTPDEVDYLAKLSKKLERPLTDAEVFGFSQVNSEHCRHKIFNGKFIIDGQEKPSSLFQLIKKTSKINPNLIVSAYKDNVAFVKGPKVQQFAPKSGDKPDYYVKKEVETVISIKAETHNFPTTVEPFNGAATGSGGEIRDRMAGGKGSIPMAGTAVYMTSYPRLGSRSHVNDIAPRPWLYQSPLDILIKASNGASDFGNKFGQPLIVGSLLTFEQNIGEKMIAYDKVIMQAGGIGYGYKPDSLKDTPKKDQRIVVMGGDNYRIGMGGAAVSSADTGTNDGHLELNAIQRSNPEMQKRVANTIRTLVESLDNPIVSIHDHGAGGHLNCLSELVEDTGGKIDISALPIGDPTLSDKEIMGNESQERMGLILEEKDIKYVKKVAERERAPFFDVGEVTGDMHFSFESKSKAKPIDLSLLDMFGSSPKTILKDNTKHHERLELTYDIAKLDTYLEDVLQLEAVACKDWLTNKVDRCVSGRVAKQQCTGPLQLPLNDVGVMALDFLSKKGVATALGHAPIAGLIDPKAGAKNAIAESLTNIIWSPMEDNLASISLSANWMWACKNEGEDARLYEAVEAVSGMAINLGINVPTGKDSLSMTQKYKDKTVFAPGTVIITAAGQCADVSKVVEPTFQRNGGSIYYIDISSDTLQLGGSSFAQVLNQLGQKAPTIKKDLYLKKTFNAVQNLIKDSQILAGHDISAGGLITCLLEMCFADINLGAEINLTNIESKDDIHLFFAENAGLIIQAKEDTVLEAYLEQEGIRWTNIGNVNTNAQLNIQTLHNAHHFDIVTLRDKWFKTSYLLDQKQTAGGLAKARFDNYKDQPLSYIFPTNFEGLLPKLKKDRKKIKAAIIREKGSNSEREMAHAMYLAGFEVKDVHMTDLISGRENLKDIQFIGAVGGFSNSDVLGSAKGWAGAFKYNEKAKTALDDFFARPNTLSVGICNGCQLFVELDLIYPDNPIQLKMDHNKSLKHESGFVPITIPDNNSVMLSSLAGTTMGVWISHGEGRFVCSQNENDYNISAKYSYGGYPSNPNGSDFNTAMMHSSDGRHLVMMPHIERSIFPWNWPHYPKDRAQDEVSPWLDAFVNAFEWLEKEEK